MKADNKVCNWSSKYKKYRNPTILHIKKQKKEKEKKRGVSSYRNLSENE